MELLGKGASVRDDTAVRDDRKNIFSLLKLGHQTKTLEDTCQLLEDAIGTRRCATCDYMTRSVGNDFKDKESARPPTTNGRTASLILSKLVEFDHNEVC